MAKKAVAQLVQTTLPDDLTVVQHQFCQTYIEEGWAYHGRRRPIVKCKLNRDMVAELGLHAATVDIDLRSQRQGKNSWAAAAQREKRERQGAISMLSGRLIEEKDELGNEMDPETRAKYAERIAALRKEYDEFEEERKATLTGFRTSLDKMEDEQSKIAAKIRDGKGDMPIDVIDLIDYVRGEVLTLDVTRQCEHERRTLDEHERQMALFHNNVDLPQMSNIEYRLAITGQLHDAARQYIIRTGVNLSHTEAVKKLRSMLPDEELPPEADEPVSDADELGGEE